MDAGAMTETGIVTGGTLYERVLGEIQVLSKSNPNVKVSSNKGWLTADSAIKDPPKAVSLVYRSIGLISLDEGQTLLNFWDEGSDSPTDDQRVAAINTGWEVLGSVLYHLKEIGHVPKSGAELVEERCKTFVTKIAEAVKLHPRLHRFVYELEIGTRFVHDSLTGNPDSEIVASHKLYDRVELGFVNFLSEEAIRHVEPR